MVMWASWRSAIFTAAIVAAALVVGAVLFGPKVEKARQACVDRGGHVEIVSDPQSIGQFCIYPSGSREPI